MTPQIFCSGLTWEAYFASMRTNQELLRRKTMLFTLPDEEKQRWQQSLVSHVLVFTEDQCQDSVSALPPLLGIAAVAAFDLRVMRRSEQLALQRALTGEEYPAIPTFFFYDADWNEVGRFVEMPHEFRRLKANPAEAFWLKEMYDELWWQTELEELATVADFNDKGTST